MNFYEAKQRESDGKWDFTWHNDNQGFTRPIGFCRDAEGGGHHDTKEEAEKCYRDYLLTKLTLEQGHLDRPVTCVVDGCEEPTKVVSKAGSYHRWYLCDAHRTREVIEEIFPSAREHFGSY